MYKICLFFPFCLSAYFSYSQLPETADSVKNVYVDVQVPNSPAFVALGTTPDQISQPGTPQELGVQILDGISGGNINNGLAVDFSPYLILNRKMLVSKYQDSWLQRVFYRTQISFGTVSGSKENNEFVNMALGVRITLWDKGDPRCDTELINSFKDALKIKNDPDAPPGSLTENELTKGEIAESIKKARKDAIARNWNASKAEIGFAPTFTSSNGTISELNYDRMSLWGTIALGLGSWGQIIGHARLSPSTEVSSGDLFIAGGRFKAGKGIWAYIIEGTYNSLSIDEATTESTNIEDNWGRFVTGFEVRIVEGLWIEAVFGSDFNRTDQNSKFLSAANIKWALANERILK